MMPYPLIDAMSSGGDNNLEVAVEKYEPHVQCSGTVSPSLLPSCQNIVDTMTASTDFTTWGPEDDPLAVVKLPIAYYSRESSAFFPQSHQKGDISNDQAERMTHSVDGRCKLSIRTDGSTDTFSRFQFWSAAVALTGICVRGGQAGRTEDLGEFHSSIGEVYGKGRANMGDDRYE